MRSPHKLEWEEICADLPAGADSDVFRTAIEAAVQAYLSGQNTRTAKQWHAVAKIMSGKGLESFAKACRALPPTDPVAKDLQRVADELERLAAKARTQEILHGPVGRRMQLYIQVMRAWTNAEGYLGASHDGPAQRLLCNVAKRVGIRLSPRGAREAIEREQKRRETLTVLQASEKAWTATAVMHVDEAGITIIPAKPR